jgi:hypothetical protein
MFKYLIIIILISFSNIYIFKYNSYNKIEENIKVIENMKNIENNLDSIYFIKKNNNLLSYYADPRECFNYLINI